MVAGHNKPVLIAGAGLGLMAAQIAAVATAMHPSSGRGQSYDEWTEDLLRADSEAARRRYRYPYDAHIRAFEDYHHARHLKALREEQERIQREKDAAIISAADAKRARKAAKRAAVHNR